MKVSVAISLSRPAVQLGLLSLAIHLICNGQYGFFRDELYFIVCGSRPDWGYVDQPPLVPLLAYGAHWLSGDWLLGFRLLPGLVMSAAVALTAEFALLVGGGRFAQWLAGLCVLFSGVLLAHGLLFSTDMFQALTWLGCCWCLVKIAQTDNQKYWLSFGVIVGVSLLSKYLVVFYLAALAPGLLLTPLRRSLLRPQLWLGAGIALLMILPNLIWQQQHGWPFLELGSAGVHGKNLALSPLDFLLQQLLLIEPLAFPVWAIGLWASAVDRSYRMFPIAYVLLFAIFVMTHGKAYYLAPAYPALLAFGAVTIEQWITSPRLRAAALALVVLSGAIAAPLAVPVLPPDTYIAYASALGMSPSAMSAEHIKLNALPQHFADMFGWPEMAASIAAAYHRLPPQEQAKAVFFGQNYGEAAAIDVFGARLGLPPAISGHNQYWLWGPRGDGSVIIVIGGDLKKEQAQFDSVEEVGRTNAPYAIPYETDKPIRVLRGLRMPMNKLWPELKHYQ